MAARARNAMKTSPQQQVMKALGALGATVEKLSRPNLLRAGYRKQDFTLFVTKGAKALPAWATAWRGQKIHAIASADDLMKALDVSPRLSEAVLTHYPVTAPTSAAKSTTRRAAGATRRARATTKRRPATTKRRPGRPRGSGKAAMLAEAEQAAAAAP